MQQRNNQVGDFMHTDFMQETIILTLSLVESYVLFAVVNVPSSYDYRNHVCSAHHSYGRKKRLLFLCTRVCGGSFTHVKFCIQCESSMEEY